MGILSNIKQNAEDLWESASEGWRSLRQQGWDALTHFDRLPADKNTSDAVPVRTGHQRMESSWSVLAGDIVEDPDKIVVRLEVPGMHKEDFDIQIQDDCLVVRGEKQCETESAHGRYRLMECAYGMFNRTLRLPAPVVIERATARYDNGVLNIALPKARPTSRSQFQLSIK